MKLPFQIDLKGKTAVITGAGGVLMSEFAKALGACGANVALLDIDYEAAEKAAKKIGENAVAVRCNCLDKASVEEAKNAVNEAFGRVDILKIGRAHV